MTMNGRSRLPLQATPGSEDSKDRDVARERTRPERQNGKLGVRLLKAPNALEAEILPLRSHKADKIIRPQIF